LLHNDISAIGAIAARFPFFQEAGVKCAERRSIIGSGRHFVRRDISASENINTIQPAFGKKDGPRFCSETLVACDELKETR